MRMSALKLSGRSADIHGIHKLPGALARLAPAFFGPHRGGHIATSSLTAMSTIQALAFSDEHLFSELQATPGDVLDGLDFGVIGFDADGVVCRYNAFESRAAGLSPERVVGHPLFTVVAPCMNNFLVAQRFDDALAGAAPLDVVIDYVLTLRMRPVKVKLRLLAVPAQPVRYVLVQRSN